MISELNNVNPLTMARNQFNPQPITKTGFYALWDEERKENVSAFVIMRAYNPDGEQNGPDSRKIVVTADGRYQIVDTELKSIPVVPFNIPVFNVMNTGDTGMLLYMLKDSTDQKVSPIIAVGPITLKARSVDAYVSTENRVDAENSDTYIRGNHKFESLKGGQLFTCEFDDYVKALGGVRKPYASHEGALPKDQVEVIQLPSRYNWVYLYDEVKFSSFKDPNDDIKKEASVVTYLDGEYSINHPDLGEWKNRTMPVYMTKFALAALGANEPAREIIMKEAQDSGKAYVAGLQFTPQKQAEDTSLTKWIDMVHDKWNFVKLAAAFDDIATVDSVLGLNFLNRANINKFISVLPKLKESRADAIRLLYVARLGATELDEESIVQTIDGLDEVILGLEKMKLRMDMLI